MAPPLYMDAVIAPKPSLSRRGFKVLLFAVVTVNVLFAVFLFVIGAWPVPMFLGLDVLGVWLAFRASYRAARRAEHVRVSAEAVTVTREGEGAARQVWASPTAFTRVLVEPGRADQPRVRLALSARRLTVAKALGAEQRSDFAADLKAAIQAARNERHEAQEAGGRRPDAGLG